MMEGDLYEPLRVWAATLPGEWEALSRSIIPHPVRAGVALGRDERIRTLAQRAEQGSEYAALLGAVAAYGGIPDRKASVLCGRFLRWCGLYDQVEVEEGVLRELAERLAEHLRWPRPVTRRYLIGLPWLSTEEPGVNIDVGWFRVRTFTQDELAEAIGHRPRKLFFPRESVSDEDLACLACEAWLEVPVMEETGEPESGLWLNFDAIGGRVRHTDLPEPVERALGRLFLLEWRAEDSSQEYWWPGFPLGTLFEVSDNLFEAPQRPVPGTMGYVMGEWGPESIGLSTFWSPELDALLGLDRSLSTMEDSEDLRFLPHQVVPYLVRAAVAPLLLSAKQDQIVSHVLALDALLGDGDTGSSGRLKKRAGILLRPVEDPRHVEAAIKGLYSTRSKLLHGGALTNMATEISWQGRRLTARIVRRAVEVLASYLNSGVCLSRSEFHAILDILVVQKRPEEIGRLVAAWPEDHEGTRALETP